MELSSSSSSKRPKAPSNIAQIVSCLVDGCNLDLSECREYHRRHKVCELHSKAPKVTIGGREQRFCQQCSRFHSLTEFDKGKRSCRKRLDGHNRRRRKPQSDSLFRTPGMFQGTRFLSFNTPDILPSAVVSSAWSGAVKADSDQGCRFEPFPISPPNSYKGGVNQFQFMQDTDQNILPASGDNGNRMFSNGLTHRAGDPDRARSLLSSSVPARIRDVNSSHVVHPGSTSLSQSLLHNLHFSGLGQYTSTQEMESKTSVSDVDSNERNNTTLHFQGMFQNEPDCSTASRAPQTPAFRWE